MKINPWCVVENGSIVAQFYDKNNAIRFIEELKAENKEIAGKVNMEYDESDYKYEVIRFRTYLARIDKLICKMP